MKKTVINLLGVLLIPILLFSCGQNNESNTEVSNVEDSINTNVEENVETTAVEEEIVFNKFEHYARILTKSELTSQFGQASLKDETVSYAEGTVEMESTVVTNPANGQIVRYVWGDDNKTTSAIEAEYNIFDKNYELIGTQKIEAENGMSLGMSIDDLKTGMVIILNFLVSDGIMLVLYTLRKVLKYKILLLLLR